MLVLWWWCCGAAVEECCRKCFGKFSLFSRNMPRVGYRFVIDFSREFVVIVGGDVHV